MQIFYAVCIEELELKPFCAKANSTLDVLQVIAEQPNFEFVTFTETFEQAQALCYAITRAYETLKEAELIDSIAKG